MIADKAFGKTYGAREIRRIIRQDVEDQIADQIINHADTLHQLTITAEQEKLVVKANEDA